MNAHVSQGGWPVLVLNADFLPLSYYPLSLWSWQDAIKAVFLDRVNIVERYVREGAGGAVSAVRNTGGAVILCSMTTTLGYLALVSSMNEAVASMGKAAVKRPAHRIERAQSRCPLQRLDRCRRSIMEALGPTEEIPGKSGIWVERERALDRGEAGGAIATQGRYRPAGHP